MDESLNQDIREELENHKYFRRLLLLLDAHPYRDQVTSLHASLIVKGGRILAIGTNQPNPNQFALSYALHAGWQSHAEFVAVSQIRKKINLTNAVMYNCRVSRNGLISLSKPCPGCYRMLLNYGFKKVVYTTPQGFEPLKIKNALQYATVAS